MVMQLLGKHTLSSAILGKKCTPNKLKLHLLCSLVYCSFSYPQIAIEKCVITYNCCVSLGWWCFIEYYTHDISTCIFLSPQLDYVYGFLNNYNLASYDSSNNSIHSSTFNSGHRE